MILILLGYIPQVENWPTKFQRTVEHCWTSDCLPAKSTEATLGGLPAKWAEATLDSSKLADLQCNLVGFLIEAFVLYQRILCGVQVGHPWLRVGVGLLRGSDPKRTRPPEGGRTWRRLRVAPGKIGAGWGGEGEQGSGGDDTGEKWEMTIGSSWRRRRTPCVPVRSGSALFFEG